MRVLLVHGYSGTPGDLAPLAEGLDEVLGPGHTRLVALHPQWRGGPPPPFDREAFLALLAAEAEGGRPLVVIGHSTGGTLALLASLDPDLLVLLATPPRVGLDHLARLQAATRPGNEAPGLLDLARLVKAINEAGAAGLPPGTLVVHGEDDPLVPPADLAHWGPAARPVRVPGAGHHLPAAPVLAAVLEALPPALTGAEQERLRLLEPQVARFADRVPGGWQALGRSPSARRALGTGMGLPPGLGPLAPPPVLANLEVTTRCPHTCPSCARASGAPHRGDLDRFQEVLDRLPHASRLTLVGLGEPTLHPRLAELVALAAGEGRSVGLVTSGAALTPDLARSLVQAGLGGATFSLDAGEADLAGRLRPGVPFARTLAHLTEAARIFGDRVPRAVFTAVGTANARHLAPVADLALALGARAWMLSDLNFAANRDLSLAGAATGEDQAAIREAVDGAMAAGLPVLHVRGLEELGKPFRLRELLLRPVDQLWSRSPGHASCLSPWQTLALGADGTITACDCQPGEVVGNLFETPFQALWNGPGMVRLRQELLAGTPRAACRHCPRL